MIMDDAVWQHADIELWKARAAELRAALERIDSINDHPGRYNPDIDAVIRAALKN